MIVYNGGDFRKYLKRDGNHFNERIKVGNFYFSIQCSSFHYAIPRTTLKNFKEYASMEVAVFDEPIDGEDIWITLDNSNLFDRFKKYKTLSESSDGRVFGYLPVDLVQELVDYFYNGQ